MGGLFTAPRLFSAPQEASLLEDQVANVLKGLKGSPKKGGKKKHARDGRTYAEVVAAGPETSEMSALQFPGPSWKFAEAPTDSEMLAAEAIPDYFRTQQGARRLPTLHEGSVQEQTEETPEVSRVPRVRPKKRGGPKKGRRGSQKVRLRPKKGGRGVSEEVVFVLRGE